MCLSSVYEVIDGAESLVCEYVTAISLNNGHITITDIMGEEIVISGILKSIDFVKNSIIIDV